MNLLKKLINLEKVVRQNVKVQLLKAKYVELLDILENLIQINNTEKYTVGYL